MDEIFFLDIAKACQSQGNRMLGMWSNDCLVSRRIKPLFGAMEFREPFATEFDPWRVHLFVKLTITL